jgi:hypothetical protein
MSNDKDYYHPVKRTSTFKFIIHDMKIYHRWVKELTNNPEYRAALGLLPEEVT